MRYLVITVLFFVLFAEAGAQSTLTGKITSQEKPVDYAQVYVLNLEGNIIATTTSDSLGIYRLQFEITADSLVVNISRLGFKPWQTTIPSGLSKLDVRLVMSSNSRLKDFVVTGRNCVASPPFTITGSISIFLIHSSIFSQKTTASLLLKGKISDKGHFKYFKT